MLKRWVPPILGVSVVIAGVFWLVVATRPQRYQETCGRNLTGIGDALHGFSVENGYLPPAWSKDDSPHSWRVALLPHLDHSGLYNLYDTNRPWDDPRNTGFLAQRPEIYACPSVANGSHTAYQSVIGPQTAWPYDNEMTWDDFLDGRSQTIHVVDYHSPTIPWTSLDDVRWKSAFSTAPMGPHEATPTLMADGQVVMMNPDMDATAWRYLLTPQKGQPIHGKTFSRDILAELLPRNNRSFAAPVSPATLDATSMSPLPDTDLVPGENRLYCPTFVLAWRKFAPISQFNVETDFSRRVLAAPFTPEDIDANEHTLIAGALSREDLLKVRSERLGLHDLPGVVRRESIGLPCAYSALDKRLPYNSEFEALESPLIFETDSGTTSVRSFGVTSGWKEWAQALKQLRVLYYVSPDDFAIQIGNLSGDDLVLAKMSRPRTIAAGMRRVDQHANESRPSGLAQGVVNGEPIVVPILEFNLIDDFTERLRGSSRPPQPFTARQLIQFRLDERGASLVAESGIIDNDEFPDFKPGERKFVFDKPFLLILRESPTNNPYFAAWIANSDLMIGGG